jgi:hypothetical protein
MLPSRPLRLASAIRRRTFLSCTQSALRATCLNRLQADLVSRSRLLPRSSSRRRPARRWDVGWLNPCRDLPGCSRPGRARARRSSSGGCSSGGDWVRSRPRSGRRPINRPVVSGALKVRERANQARQKQCAAQELKGDAQKATGDVGETVTCEDRSRAMRAS